MEKIVYQTDESMELGLNLYFDLALKHGLIAEQKPLQFLTPTPVID
jgi:hypothetical protein